MDTKTREGVEVLLILILSAQPDLSFTVSDDLLIAFPFKDYTLEAERPPDGNYTTWKLRKTKADL